MKFVKKFFPSLILENKNFRSLFFAGLFSELGGFVTDTAVLLAIYKLSGNDSFTVALSKGLFLGSFVIGSTFGSTFGVKKSRLSILRFCEFIRIPITLPLLFLSSVPLLIILNMGIGFFTGVFNPNKKTLANDLVSHSQIRQGQSLLSTSFAFIHLIAPAGAAYAYSYFQSLQPIIIFDLVTYATGLILLLKIKPPTSPIQKLSQKHLELMKEGIKFAWNRYDLKSFILNGLIVGPLVGILLSLLLPYIQETYNNSDIIYGQFITLFGLGGLFGGTTYYYFTSKLSFFKAFHLAIMLEAVLFIVWILINNIYASYIIFFLWGVLVFSRLTGQFSYVSENIHKNLQPRLFNILDLSFMITNVIASLIIAFATEIYTIRDIYLSAGIIYVVLNLIKISWAYPKKEYAL